MNIKHIGFILWLWQMHFVTELSIYNSDVNDIQRNVCNMQVLLMPKYFIDHGLVFPALDRVGPSYRPVQEMSAKRKARILLLVHREFGYGGDHAMLVHEERGVTFLRGRCPSFGLGEYSYKDDGSI